MSDRRGLECPLSILRSMMKAPGSLIRIKNAVARGQRLMDAPAADQPAAACGQIQRQAPGT
jgi:hypothetical protein